MPTDPHCHLWAVQISLNALLQFKKANVNAIIPAFSRMFYCIDGQELYRLWVFDQLTYSFLKYNVLSCITQLKAKSPTR